MKIRLRFTLLFATLFAALLLVFAACIYFFYAADREQQYYDRLQQQAITKAKLLLEARVTPSVLQLIYKHSLNSLPQEEVAIYDTAFHLLYHDAVEIDKVKETQSMIDSIVAVKEIHFYVGKLQAIGFLYAFGGKHYVITAAARDDYGLAKLSMLRTVLFTGYGIVILLTVLAGAFFSARALKPLSELVNRVEDVTASRLDLRIDEGNGKDEIAELAQTFNRMLDRLENSFNAQKDFVSNISHELRTPLAAIIGELEITASRDRTIPEYKQMIRFILSDAQRLVKLSNGLLDLAKASYDQAEIAFRNLRLDELLLDTRKEIIKANPDYHIKIIFEREIEDGGYISVKGNEYLLKVAFTNLMENGCKFSDNRQSVVAISFHESVVIIRFSDSGIGIPPQDLPDIFKPFYRGANQAYSEGNGIGLSLSDRIIHLHKGTVSVTSGLTEGTVFTVELPHV